MVFLITLSLICLAVFLIYKYLTWNFAIWRKLGLDGPKPRIIYGNFPSIITGKQPLVYDVDEIYNAYKNTHAAIGVFMTRNPEILLLDPKLAHELLVSNFSKFRDNLSNRYVLNKKYDKYAARNPFFITGATWKEKRGDATIGLTVSRLNSAYPIWINTASKLRQYVQQHVPNDGSAVLDTKDLAARFTIDIIGDFLWGVDADSFKHKKTEDNRLLHMSMKMLEQAAIAEGLYSNLNIAPFLKCFFPRSRVFPLETDNFFSDLTKDAMQSRLKNATNLERKDFLNYVIHLQAKKHLPHDDVMGHMLTVVLDGYETAAMAIYHTLFYLARYPHVQDKLRAEIQPRLEKDGFMTFENINNLPYLEQCIFETLRMISPLPKISRICTQATELQIDGNTCIPIKPGMVLTIPLFSYHHDEDYFPNSYQYNPDRFNNKAHIELTKRGILLPFGDGPRVCIGLRLAQLEIKACIIEILKDYRISCTPQTVQEKKPDAHTFIFGLEGDFSLAYERI